MRRFAFALMLAALAPWPSARAGSAYTAAAPTALRPWVTCTVAFSPPTGAGRAAPTFRRVPVATTPAQQHTGLKVAASGGLPMMLFAWPKPSFYPFWMYQVNQPLSVAFIDPTGHVSRITAMAPNTRTWYWPPSSIVAALEVPTPLFSTVGIKVGWVFHVKDCPVAGLQAFKQTQ